MHLMLLIFLYIIWALLSVVYSSFFELVLHKFLMHRPFLFIRRFFESHALKHHRIFGFKETFHLTEDPAKREADQKTIPMAWWNGPVLVFILSILPFVVSALSKNWVLLIITAIIGAFYYATYEYTHWCMHKPLGRWFEKTKFFLWIKEHHRLHHEHQGRNFNVFCPIADKICGTFISK